MNTEMFDMDRETLDQLEREGVKPETLKLVHQAFTLLYRRAEEIKRLAAKLFQVRYHLEKALDNLDLQEILDKLENL